MTSNSTIRFPFSKGFLCLGIPSLSITRFDPDNKLINLLMILTYYHYDTGFNFSHLKLRILVLRKSENLVYLVFMSSQSALTCSKLTIETLEQDVNFKDIQHLVKVFLLLTLSM